MIIYCIQNLITDKKYIGKHVGCFSNEEFQKSRYWGSGIYIKRAIQKYSLENFRKWVLIHCDDEDGSHYETLWIKKLNSKTPNGYNLTNGGDGFDSKTRKEYCATHKQWNDGMKMSDEFCQKMKNLYLDRKDFRIGQKRNLKTKNLISEKIKGIKRTETTKQLIREAALLRWENGNFQLKVIKCNRCDKIFKPSGPNQKRCNDCRKISHYEWKKEQNEKISSRQVSL